MSLPAGEPYAARWPSPVPVVGFALEALRRARHGAHDLVAVSVPAPRVELESLWKAAGTADALVWDPPEGPGFATAGIAAELCPRGAGRMPAVRDAARALWPRLRVTSHPEVSAPPPRLFGGFAFAPNAAATEPWPTFGDARFFLPRWSYGRDGERAWLTLCAGVDELHELHDLAAELERVLAALAAARPEPLADATALSIRELDPELWRQQIESIRRAIIKQAVDKIVAARCTEVELSRPIDPTAVIGRLRGRHPDCYRFGLRLGDVCFVGASPERLVARRGDEVQTEALAGSIARESGDARALLASHKDRGEQQLVVEAIERALAPLCAELDVAPEPQIRELRDVLHLRTPLCGRLSGHRHVLDLVAALHPTPAVGGVPTRAAVSWITEHETQPRGWYASPFGWFDAEGDGEFTVAIRSGVLRERLAYVYAGGGIVRDSDPEAEYAETRLKQRALLAALGVHR